MLPGLVAWQQPISAAASSLVGVHRNDRRLIGALAAVAT
jgi:hypothetical protein